MKKRKLLPGFALAALMALGLAGTAHAQTYTSCANFNNNIPSAPTGDVVVNNTGACSLNALNVTTGSFTVNSSGAITASTVEAFTEVTLTATGGALTASGAITTHNNRTIQLTAPGAITTAAIAGNGHVGINSTGSTVTINGTLQSALGGTAGNIWLQANGNIKTVAITTNAGGGAGGVQIDANKGGANVLFKIGASSANGINGVLTTHNGTFITNGTAASTGGITITNGNKIVTGSATADGGLLFFNAQKGTFELTAGTLKTDGVSGHHSGSLVIMADTVKTAGTAIISASQAAGTAGINHFVGLSTKNLNITGTSLAIKSDGDGVAGFFATSSLVPPGALTVASNGNLISLAWTVTASNTFSTNVPVAVTGGALTMTANGNSAQVQVSGYPVTFSNTTIDLQSKGKTNHSVQFDYFATGTGPDGLIFNNTGLVSIDASGTSGGTGGFVDLQQFGTTGGGIRINTPPTFTVNTNGPSSGGNAGPVNFNAPAATVGAATKVVITANGPSAGAGNGSVITLHPGTANLKFGTNNGDIQLLANGGSTTGDGGTLDVNPLSGSITIDTANALSATVPGTDGKGGTVTLFANGAFSVTPAVSGATINVDGKGTKDGGSITIFGTSGSVNLGTAAGGLSLSASGGGNAGKGNGGSVDIGALSSVTISADLSVAAGTGAGGNGHGGTLNFHGLGGFTVSGTPIVNADGHGSGIAGSITVGMFSFGTMTLDGATFSASGDTASSGNGNQLTFTNLGTISAANATLKANGGQTGAGGNIGLTTSFGTLTLTGSGTMLLANGGTSAGNAGQINISNTGGDVSVLSGAKVSAAVLAGSGNGGLINIFAGSPTVNGIVTITSGTVIADAGISGGNAQQVTLKYSNPGTTDGIIVGGTSLVSNNASSSSAAGSIIFQNQNDTATLGLQVNGAAVISAIKGTLRLIQPNGIIDISGNSTAVDGPLLGNIVATSKDIAVNFPVAGGPLTIQTMRATTGNVTINALNSAVVVIATGSADAVSAVAGNVNLSADGFQIGLGAAPGQDFVQGLTVSIQTGTSSNANIFLGSDVRADDQITLAVHGIGNIKSIGGRAGSVSPGESTRLDVSVENGTIGNGDTDPFLTGVSELGVVTTTSATTAVVSISNQTSNTAGLLIDDNLIIGGFFIIQSNGDVSVGNVTSGQGLLSITSGTGTLLVRSNAVITANEGNIALQNSDASSGIISVGAGANLTAKTGTTNGFLGNVLIYLGAIAQAGNNHLNTNVMINGDPNFVDFGNVGIDAFTPVNTVNVTKRTVGFDAKTTHSAIALHGSVTITAQGQ
jgi:hypothetical protein